MIKNEREDGLVKVTQSYVEKIKNIPEVKEVFLSRMKKTPEFWVVTNMDDTPLEIRRKIYAVMYTVMYEEKPFVFDSKIVSATNIKPVKTISDTKKTLTRIFFRPA